jgi:hypothetical protein
MPDDVREERWIRVMITERRTMRGVRGQGE